MLPILETGSKQQAELVQQYVDTKFPYLVGKEEKESKTAKEMLESAFNKGPIAIDSKQVDKGTGLVSKRNRRNFK